MASVIADDIKRECNGATEIYLCGGGAYNIALFECLTTLLQPIKINVSDEIGIKVDAVEAAAFAWLARQTLLKAPGNLPDVTGADGLRILGAVYAG